MPSVLPDPKWIEDAMRKEIEMLRKWESVNGKLSEHFCPDCGEPYACEDDWCEDCEEEEYDDE